LIAKVGASRDETKTQARKIVHSNNNISTQDRTQTRRHTRRHRTTSARPTAQRTHARYFPPPDRKFVNGATHARRELAQHEPRHTRLKHPSVGGWVMRWTLALAYRYAHACDGVSGQGAASLVCVRPLRPPCKGGGHPRGNGVSALSDIIAREAHRFEANLNESIHRGPNKAVPHRPASTIAAANS